MKNVVKLVGACVAIELLTACGGGGDDSVASTKSYSQAEVKTAASLGAAVIEVTGERTLSGMGYLSGALAGLSIDDAASSQTVALPCASGTGSAKVTKATAHAGFIKDDEIEFIYNKCAFANGDLLNGAAKLTLKDAASFASSGGWSANFKAHATGFEVTTNSATLRYQGDFEFIQRTTNGLNSSVETFTVPSGYVLAVNALTGTTSAFVLSYGPGLTFEAGDVTSPNSATRKITGPVVATLPRLPSGRLTFATPTTLTGTRTAANLFLPIAGVFNVSVESQGSQTLATSTTVNTGGVTVSGDSDGNGSLDLVFNATWAALLTP